MITKKKKKKKKKNQRTSTLSSAKRELKKEKIGGTNSTFLNLFGGKKRTELPELTEYMTFSSKFAVISSAKSNLTKEIAIPVNRPYRHFLKFKNQLMRFS